MLKIQHKPGERHWNTDSLIKMATQQVRCKKYKRNVTKEYVILLKDLQL